MIRGKRAFVNQIMIVFYVFLVLAVIISLIYLGGLALPLISNSSGEITGMIQQASDDSGDSNLSYATQESFGNANNAVQQLEWIFLFLIVFIFLGFIAMCFYVRTYPFLAFVWIIFMIIIIFFSLLLTSAYQDTSSDAGISASYTSWEDSHFYMSNMPIILTVIGLVGGIVMFILASKDPESEVGLQ